MDIAFALLKFQPALQHRCNQLCKHCTTCFERHVIPNLARQQSRPSLSIRSRAFHQSVQRRLTRLDSRMKTHFDHKASPSPPEKDPSNDMTGIMQESDIRSPAGIVATSMSGSQQSATTDHNGMDTTQSLSLDDLPAELIGEIVRHIRWRRKPPVPSCRCVDIWLSTYPPSNCSREPTKEDLDPSSAFSWASKRYREIVLQTKEPKGLDLCYSACCVKKVLDMPEERRASFTYVPEDPARLFKSTDDIISNAARFLCQATLIGTTSQKEKNTNAAANVTIANSATCVESGNPT